MEMMSDPDLIPIMDQCCEFCWFHCNAHAINTPEWHEYKERTLAGRPTTFDLLDAIWLRYQDHLDQQNRSALLGQLQAPEEPEVADPLAINSALEESSDADIQKLMRDTTRQYAKEVRAGIR